MSAPGAVWHLNGVLLGETACGRWLNCVPHSISWDAWQARRGRPLPDGGRICKACLRTRQ